jgi:hypothetical protein
MHHALHAQTADMCKSVGFVGKAANWKAAKRQEQVEKEKA